jgi:Domain of unknown function (DUF4157)
MRGERPAGAKPCGRSRVGFPSGKSRRVRTMRALTPTERTQHIHVPEVDRDRARVAVTRFLFPGAGAMTVGHFVLIRPGREHDERLLAHELVHVRQWREEGRLRFVWRYFTAYFKGRYRGLRHRDAYRAIPYEAEARELAGE